MQVEKVINNNIIRTLDENSNELIVMGSGLGFKKKPGDPVDKTKIEKI
ncbi:CAT RNA binding domain-containing protein [Allobaculum stercoricanis]|nr:CAT RNA binding domain-containing protein [Allobaculum stercoricanis]